MFSFHHVATSVKNMQQSLNFYSLFGFTAIFQWQAEDGSLEIVHMQLGEALLELFCYASAESVSQLNSLEQDLASIGVKHFALRVTDLEQTAARLKEQGLVAEAEIKQGRTGVSYLFFTDPDGLFVEIVQDDRQQGQTI